MNIEAATKRVTGRLEERAIRALKKSRDEKEHPVVRQLMDAYLTVVCKRRPEFMRAAFHSHYGDYMWNKDETLKEGALEELIVSTPARWEFRYCHVFGDVPEACCCANRYDACAEFIGVQPLAPEDPWHPINIAMRHTADSPWFLRLTRRRELKRMLGRKYQSLVGYAKRMTKGEFLEQIVTRSGEETKQMVDRRGRTYNRIKVTPDISVPELLNLTGYTPEEFWRECKKPGSVAPKKPQLELALL